VPTGPFGLTGSIQPCRSSTKLRKVGPPPQLWEPGVPSDCQERPPSLVRYMQTATVAQLYAATQPWLRSTNATSSIASILSALNVGGVAFRHRVRFRNSVPVGERRHDVDR
jgi:hypothetical protein